MGPEEAVNAISSLRSAWSFASIGALLLVFILVMWRERKNQSKLTK
jgi:hypothetical protein